MKMGQTVLNKDSNEVKRFIEAMEGISKILDANSLIYRPILDGHRYITMQHIRPVDYQCFINKMVEKSVLHFFFFAERVQN